MTVRNFRFLLTASLLIGLFGGFVDTVLPQLLPELFQQAMEAEYQTVSGPHLVLMGILGVALLIITCAAYYGLYRLRPWGPKWAMLSTVLAQPLFILIGATAQSGYATAALYIASYCWGAVLLLAFLPPFSQQFQRQET